MILVIIIAAAWIVILTPSLMKRRSQTVGEIGSISHFHRQLRVLEHSGPQPIVTPAYRLRSVDGSGVAKPNGSGYPEVAARPVLSVVGARQLPRPALAFLGEEPDGVSAGGGDPRPVRTFDDVGQSGRWPSLGSVDGGMSMPSRPSATDTRFLVRKRRRDTLGVMAAIFSGTILIGFVPGASAAWILTALSGVALAAYVTVLVQLRRTAEERERKLHYLRPEGLGEPGSNVRPPPVAMSGRYAHPSNQAVAAR
jgi:hypothetical protein